ncbi:MAG: inositol 2-dehydrogenase [Candidatus Humimicrobiaceae bacterium]|jgi:myo-inositol 2-dehydrogenase/D-chiro-inositol 1-dehydrogenase|nr:inositol 2-dehydrogenase [Actinomycetota bacterium]MDY0027621.1 inositol 2-dehydrogenase [Candidatus Humimicrobiaceae bacterium]
MNRKTSEVNVGIIGTGKIGFLHCRNLVYNISEANVLSVADVRLEAARRCAEEFGIPKFTQDYKEILSDNSIDAVIICSSTDTHSSLIEEAAKAKKHIFCEKPIALELKEIDRALNAVKESGVKLQVGFNRRFDPNFHKAREIIKDGKIGKVLTIKIISRDPAPPGLDYLKVSGGIFADSTIHDFDMARYIIGSEVIEVYASGGVLKEEVCRKAGDLDIAITILKFENGSIGVIENSRSTVYGYDQRVEVFGSGGVVSVGNKLLDTVEIIDSEAIKKSLLPYFFTERYVESYINEMKEFMQSILKDTAPLVSGIDGKIPILIAKAAKLSYDANKPVKVAELM